MADYNDPIFPTTPVSLNYAGVTDKTTYGRRTSDYTKHLAHLDRLLTDLRTNKLPRAEEEMMAHRTIWQGAYDAAVALLATAAAQYCLPSGSTAEAPVTFDIKDWDYIYDAARLTRSIFFPYTETGGRFEGNPLDHPTCTFVYTPPPEELDPATEQPIPPDPPLPPDGVALAAQYTQQFAAIMAEYNMMIKVLLRVSEGSAVKVQSLHAAIEALELDRAHTVLTQSLSDNSGATAVATKLPALWNDDEQYTDSWQEYINPDDL